MTFELIQRLKKAPRRAVNKRSDKVHPLVREHFDIGWYLANNNDLAAVKDLAQHYADHGWREGRDPNENFSVTDYLESYPDVRGANIDPFLHYLLHGRHEARTSVLSRRSPLRPRYDFFKETGIYLTDFPEQQFRAAPYAHAAGMQSANRWNALAHFVNHGITEPRLFAAAKPAPSLLRVIADRIAGRSSEAALRCYQLALQNGESDSQLLHELGDIYMQRDLPWNACQSYRLALEKGSKYFWTYYNLATCLRLLGDYAGAIDAYDKAWKLRPERLAVRFTRDSVAAERFWVRHSVASSLAIEGEDNAACKEIEEAIAEYCDLVMPDGETNYNRPPRTDRRLRIAILGLESIPQCRLYRVQQKIDQLEHAGMEPHLFHQTQATLLRDRVGLYDAVIIYRLPAIPEIIDVIASARRFGVTTFYDIDDLIFDADLYPPSRESLADVVSPVVYAGLVVGRSLHREAIALCDFGIASTPPLRTAISAIVRQKKSLLSRNALGRTHLAAIGAISRADRTSKQPFIIFYGSGTNTHNADFALVAPAVSAILRKYPNAKMHIVGPVDIGRSFAGLETQIVKLGFTPNLNEYWTQLSKADVNLAPLLTSSFNDAKSEIKWMEAAMFSVPSIVSSSATLDSVIRPNEDGFIAKSERDWYTILQRLITECGLGFQIGSNAHNRVKHEYGLESCSRMLVNDIYAALPDSDIRTKPLILLVNIFYPPEYIGGATRVVEQCATDLRQYYGKEFDIEIFCGREPDGHPGHFDRYRWNGVAVTSMGPFGDVDAVERSVDTHSSFEMYLDQVKPDLVHFHCIQRLSASLVDVVRDKAIPYIVTAHDGWWISDKQFLLDDSGIPVSQTGAWGDQRRLNRLRDCLLAARATIAVSDTQGQLYRSRGIDNIIVIPNGSEMLKGVTPPPADGPVWLGLLGGFGREKGMEILYDTLNSHHFRNLRFLLVDHTMLEGTERQELWGANEVRIIGKTSFENVGEVYGSLHGVLAISICVESFGLVAREAQRLGRWVIASNRGGMSEDITSGVDGFVIDPSNTKDLISILTLMDADPARFRQAPPKTTVQLRSRVNVIHDLAKLYSSITDGIKPVGVDTE